MISRMRVVGVGLVIALALAACTGGGESPNPSPSPLSSVRTLHVTVNAGGDCSAAEDTYVVRVLDPDGFGTRRVGGDMSEVTMLEPGIVPCRFTFTIPEVGGGRVYYLVNETKGRGWGPWLRVGLAARDFRIEVDVTDLD